MGYWFQSVGFRNYDAAWAPGLAYVALDTDFGDGELKQNIAFTAGAFWPSFGYFEKYDTYTLGRFRQLGAQLKLTSPLNPDVTVTPVLGFGTGRDGTFNPGAPPFYGAKTADRFDCLRKRQSQLREDLRRWSSHQHLVDLRPESGHAINAGSQVLCGGSGGASLGRRRRGKRAVALPGSLVALPVLHQRSKWLGAQQRGHRGHAFAERRRHRHELPGLEQPTRKLHRQRIDDQFRLPL